MANHTFGIIITIGFTVIAIVMAKSLNREKRYADQLSDVEFHFDCADRAVGFYADVEYNCQVFYMCDNFGRRIPMICPNETAFNQEFRVCDWEYNVDCKDSDKWYHLNDLTWEKPRSAPPPEEEINENENDNLKKKVSKKRY